MGYKAKQKPATAQHKHNGQICLHSAHCFTVYVSIESWTHWLHFPFSDAGHKWRQQCPLLGTYTLGTQSGKK